jgi:hypothetical protein
MTGDRRRAAEMEALFREVNERIAETAERLDADSVEFQCECANAQCTERVEAELDDYEHVRSDGATFLLAAGHEDERIERIVKRRRGHSIVEKIDAVAAAIVRRLDPRAAES